MLVVIRGAGDIATGIALRLWRSHIRVVMTDIERPTAIRRTVCFSQAVVFGETTVEDMTAKHAETPAQALEILETGMTSIPLHFSHMMYAVVKGAEGSRCE